LNLSIVIVNWNSGTQLRNCVASITETARGMPGEYQVDEIVIVDNGSTDGSELDLDAGEVPLRLLCNQANRGFAAACNQGAADVKSELILFLNPDTTLFADSLTCPMKYLSKPEQADVGIVGIQLIDDTNVVARSCARFPRPSHFVAQALGLDRLLPTTAHFMREWNHAQSREVDHVIGAFFLMRRSLFVALAGFDETFFVYFEDLDLSLRARQAGWRNVYLAQAQAYHKGGGTSTQVLGRRLFYSLRSRLQYGRKHFSRTQQVLVALTTWLIEPVTRIVHLALTARFREISHVLEAYWLLITDSSTSQR
jgi:hypothetical protein